MGRVQAQLEDNVKLMAELGEQLKKLENEAGEIMTAFKEAEVGLCGLTCVQHFFCESTHS